MPSVPLLLGILSILHLGSAPPHPLLEDHAPGQAGAGAAASVALPDPAVPGHALPGPALPGPALPDTFLDAGAEELFQKGRAARGVLEDGLEAWDARMWERTRVGLDGDLFRRGRGLFYQERLAEIGWRATGERIIRWEALRREVPVAGWSAAGELEGSDDGEDEEGATNVGSSLLGEIPPPLRHDPGSDRLVFLGEGGGGMALDPLADTATRHYRYTSGDTLRLQLPGAEAPLTLRELRVQPRRSDFRLVTASLWFEEASGALVRAIYRPSRPFDLTVDTNARGAARLLVPPFTAEIRVVSVDYGLQELRWWLPRRFVFDGEARVGRFVSVPVEVEWELSDLRTNELADLAVDYDSPPDGWRTARGVRAASSDTTAVGDSLRVVWAVPPDRELLLDDRLDRARPPGGGAFTPGEVEALEAQIRQLALRPPGVGPDLRWGLSDGLTRFNRVEGLSTGVEAALELSGGRQVAARIQVGLAEPLPSMAAEYRTGGDNRTRTLTLHSGLVASARHDRALGLPASISTAILGGGPSPFHRASGVGVRWDRRLGPTTRGFLRLAAEDQRSVEKNTDLHLRRAFSDGRTLPAVQPALPGQWGLAGAGIRWYSGEDPARTRAFGRIDARGGGGTTEWGQAEGRFGITLPLSPGGRLAAAGEVGAGGSVGTTPPQARFFPGGADDFRGLRIGERTGEHMGLARLELGWGAPAGRLTLFGDALRLGGEGADASFIHHNEEVAVAQGIPTGPAPRSLWAAGVGASLVDGLVRMDLARTSVDGGRWRFLFYLDGLF